jgi:putative MATE family efflux protein
LNQKTQIRDFTKGSIPRQLISFATPLFLSNMLQIVYNMVDMIVVGNVLGDSGISAVSVGGDVSNLLTFIAMGFSSAGQVIIARLIGGGERHRLSRFVGTMVGFLATAALVMTALGLILQDTMLALMKTPAEAYEGAVAYSTVCMAGLIFIYGYNTTSAILRGMGDSKRPFIFISIAAVLNLLLDLVFVAGLRLGAGGAALATVISQAVSVVISTAYLVRNRKRYELDMRLSHFVKWDRELLGNLVGLGVPMAIKTCSIQVSKLFVNAFVNGYGVAVSAFSGIANKLASISNLISQSMNVAGSTMVGQNLAAGKFKRVKRVMATITIITLAVSITLSVAICLFPEAIFSLFTSEENSEVLALVDGYLPIAVLMFMGSAFRSMMNALLNGSGNLKVNFATAILDGIIMRIGLAVLFGLVLDMKHYGFWLGDALAGFTPFFIGLVFFLSGSWKKGAKIKGEDED